jgi:hypothetical protein
LLSGKNIDAESNRTHRARFLDFPHEQDSPSPIRDGPSHRISQNGQVIHPDPTDLFVNTINIQQVLGSTPYTIYIKIGHACPLIQVAFAA